MVNLTVEHCLLGPNLGVHYTGVNSYDLHDLSRCVICARHLRAESDHNWSQVPRKFLYARIFSIKGEGIKVKTATNWPPSDLCTRNKYPGRNGRKAESLEEKQEGRFFYLTTQEHNQLPCENGRWTISNHGDRAWLLSSPLQFSEGWLWPAYANKTTYWIYIPWKILYYIRWVNVRHINLGQKE